MKNAKRFLSLYPYTGKKYKGKIFGFIQKGKVIFVFENPVLWNSRIFRNAAFFSLKVIAVVSKTSLISL